MKHFVDFGKFLVQAFVFVPREVRALRPLGLLEARGVPGGGRQGGEGRGQRGEEGLASAARFGSKFVLWAPVWGQVSTNFRESLPEDFVNIILFSTPISS